MLVLLEGLDDGLRDDRWQTAGMPNVQAGGRVGNRQWSNDSGGDYMRYDLAAADQHATLTLGLFVEMQLMAFAVPSASNFVWAFKGDAGATSHIGIMPNAAGYITVYRGNTLIGTTADIVFPGGVGSQRYIEMQVTLHDTTGAVKIWSDGVVVLDLSGIDTKNGGTNAVFDRVVVCAPQQKVGLYFDDVYITNGAGGELGDISVDTLFPNGNGNYSQFVGSDGNSVDNYLLTDENPHDSDTSYVESGTDTERDSYGFTDLVFSTGVISGVIASAVARNTGAADNLQISTRLGGVDYDGGTQAAPAGYDASVREVWELSPATAGAWTIAEINGAEFGIENVA